jgi:hypothetical protein
VRNLKEVDVSGGLALDTYDAIVKNARKPLLYPGKSGDSLLIQLMLTPDTEKRMPLGSEAAPPEAVALLRRWIDSGAKEGMRTDTDTTESVVRPAARKRKLNVVLNAAPLRLTLAVGPLSPITAVTFSPDGKLLAMGYYGQVTVWDLASVQPVKVLTNVLGAVNDLRFSPDGKILAVAGGQPSAKGDLRLFQVSDWKLLGQLPGHDDVVACVAFRPDGKQLASACFDRKVRLWDLASLKLERTLTGHSDFVYSVAYSPDGSWLASCGKDRSVKVVETATGKSRLTFSGMDQDVLAVAVGVDGQVVSSGYEAGLYWWNSKTGERVRVQGGHGVAVHELAFSRDGKVLLSAGADGTMRTWETGAGAPLKTMSVGSLVYACAIHPDGKLAASGSFDGLVRLWDTSSGRQLVTLLALPNRDNQLGWLALTPEGYLAGTPELLASGAWQVGNNKVEGDKLLKAVVQPANVVKAVKGETLTPPVLDPK